MHGIKCLIYKIALKSSWKSAQKQYIYFDAKMKALAIFHNTVSINFWKTNYIHGYIKVECEREIYFKALTHVDEGAGKYEIRSEGW